MTTTANTTLRELDHRISDGIDVTLFWRPEDDRAVVAVSDAKTSESFTLEVAPDQNALDVFHHPYAYAPDSVLKKPGGELAPAG
jgi:hypothetical protein